MQYDASQPRTRKRALVDQLGGDLSTPSEQGGYAGGALGAPQRFDDRIPAASLYASTPEQNAEIQRRQGEVNARNQAGFDADGRRLAAYGGNVPSDFQFSPVETFDPRSVLGDSAVNLAAPTVAGQMAATPPPAADFSRLNAGYNTDKLNDPNKQSAKYVMGRTLAGFDPTQGISPDVLSALNGLGYGTFSGSGDKLSLSGLTDAGRKAGLTGDYTGADFIQGFKGGKGQWSYADPAYEAQNPQASPGSRPSFAGSTIPTLLQSDAQGNIQQALQNIGALSDTSRLQQLIAALGAGR